MGLREKGLLVFSIILIVLHTAGYGFQNVARNNMNPVIDGLLSTMTIDETIGP